VSTFAFARRLAATAGVEVRRFRPAGERRAQLLHRWQITTVIDVGAHVGAYGLELRRFGYRGKIISFEPVAAAYESLRSRARQDPDWVAYRLALGEAGSSADMLVTTNLASSSLLPMLPRHRALDPDVAVVRKEPVEVRTLDGAVSEGLGKTLLKLDVQGYEDRVLAGAHATLKTVRLVECELCVLPLYESQRSLHEMLDLLRDLGFVLMALEPGSRIASGAVGYYDGIFAPQGLVS
jgi:FkbM family methyltransferase